MELTAEERRAINCRNAERSTGPRSAAGKARASLNALKHGLRAEAVALPNEEAEELKQLTDAWVDYYQPASPGRRALLDRAVLATVQLKRCARFQAATLSKQVREAEERWDQQQEEEVEGFKSRLKDDSAAAVRGLRRSAPGCRWLIEQWDKLKSFLDRDGCWIITSRCDQALRLLGKQPDLVRTDDEVFWLHFVNLSAHANPPEAHLAWYLEHKEMPDTYRRLLVEEGPLDRDDSVQELRAIVAGQLKELTAREERLRREIEEPGRAEAGDRALLLTGLEGALWLRYERMHDAAFHRAYKALEKSEEDASEESAEAPAPNEAGAPPAPPAEPAPAPNEADAIQVITPNEAGEAPETEAVGIDRREIDGIEVVKTPEGAGIPAVDSPVKADPAGLLPVGAA